jgi:hypothetical protein
MKERVSRRQYKIMLLMLLCSAAVSAHETFAWPISGWAEVGDMAIVPIGSGHNTTSTEITAGVMQSIFLQPCSY